MHRMCSSAPAVFGVMICTRDCRARPHPPPALPLLLLLLPGIPLAAGDCCLGGALCCWKSDAPRTTVCTASVAPPSTPSASAAAFSAPVQATPASGSDTGTTPQAFCTSTSMHTMLIWVCSTGGHEALQRARLNRRAARAAGAPRARTRRGWRVGTAMRPGGTRRRRCRPARPAAAGS